MLNLAVLILVVAVAVALSCTRKPQRRPLVVLARQEGASCSG